MPHAMQKDISTKTKKMEQESNNRCTKRSFGKIGGRFVDLGRAIPNDLELRDILAKSTSSKVVMKVFVGEGAETVLSAKEAILKQIR